MKQQSLSEFMEGFWKDKHVKPKHSCRACFGRGVIKFTTARGPGLRRQFHFCSCIRNKTSAHEQKQLVDEFNRYLDKGGELNEVKQDKDQTKGTSEQKTNDLA